MVTPTGLYDQDFYAWALKNAELIHQGRFVEVDLEHVAEGLEGIGRSERHELINRLAVLLAHLLKWRFQPERGRIRSTPGFFLAIALGWVCIMD